MPSTYYFVPYKTAQSNKTQHLTIFASSSTEAQEKADDELKRRKVGSFKTGEPDGPHEDPGKTFDASGDDSFNFDGLRDQWDLN